MKFLDFVDFCLLDWEQGVSGSNAFSLFKKFKLLLCCMVSYLFTRASKLLNEN